MENQSTTSPLQVNMKGKVWSVTTECLLNEAPPAPLDTTTNPSLEIGTLVQGNKCHPDGDGIDDARESQREDEIPTKSTESTPISSPALSKLGK